MSIDAPIHTNENNLSRVLGAGLPVLLVFWRRDCAPCDQLAPILDRLARNYAGRALIVKINAGEETELLSLYSVSHLPTILFFKDGREVAKGVGAAGESELAAWLESLTSGSPRPAVPSGPSIPLQSPAADRTPPSPGSQPGRAREHTSSAAGQGQPVSLTDANFDQTIRSTDMPMLVDFWAEWCGPCKMVAPVVEQLAREFAGRALMGKLNVDENPMIAGRYGIMSIPTLLIFRNGQVVDRIVGAQPAQVLRERLARQAQ
jgi:thioredoxin 1